jgi:rRNA-processing protein FCF1
MEELVRRYRRKGLLLDTNLLLPYLVGLLHPRYLEACGSRTRYFGQEDYPLLVRFVALFDPLVTTPHILTEVSNLIGQQLKGRVLTEVRALFHALIARLSERFEASATVSAQEDFLRFGLTDAAISMTPPNRYLVLTDDAQLDHLLRRRRVDVVNFNQVRAEAWR